MTNISKLVFLTNLKYTIPIAAYNIKKRITLKHGSAAILTQF